MTGTEQTNATKQALLDAAAALFAEKGFEAVSVREITGKAGANVASVKYHFGSREGLIDAVMSRFADPVNDERLRRLDELEERGGATVREILQAFFEPLFFQVKSSPLSEKLFVKLMGRLVGDRPFQFSEEMMEKFRGVARRYVPALMEVCPGLSAEEVFWRIHFSFGVASNALTHRDLLEQISEGAVGDDDLAVMMQRVMDFCEGGFVR